jgi:two-component system CheB/CheR fusion protein
MLLENLMDASTIRARRFSVTPRETDLCEVIQEAALMVEPLLGPTGRQIVLDLPAAPLMLDADAQYLRQALVNLLHNAIKYGAPRQPIEVRVRGVDDAALVEVQDWGPGIPAEEQPFVFDRFFRGHTGRQAGQGSGLGLAIVRAIVQAHGGQVGVRSATGSATTFWFTLPVAG